MKCWVKPLYEANLWMMGFCLDIFKVSVILLCHASIPITIITYSVMRRVIWFSDFNVSGWVLNQLELFLSLPKFIFSLQGSSISKDVLQFLLYVYNCISFSLHSWMKWFGSLYRYSQSAKNTVLPWNVMLQPIQLPMNCSEWHFFPFWSESFFNKVIVYCM